MAPDSSAPPKSPSSRPEGSKVFFVGALLVLAAGLSANFLAAPEQLHLPRCSEPFDAAIYPWNFRWFEDSWTAPDGHLLFTRRFFHPVGEGLALYTPTFFYGLMALPFSWLLDTPFAGNVAVAFLLSFSCVATAGLAYLLLRRLGWQVLGSCAAALLFTFCSARVMNAARLNLFCTEFLLLALLVFVDFWQRGGHRRGFWFAAASSILLLQSQPLFFQLALVLGTCLTFHGASSLVSWIKQGRAGNSPSVLWRICLASAPLLVILPWWVPLHRLLIATGLLVAWFATWVRRKPETRMPWVTSIASFLLLSGPFLWAMVGELRESPALAQSAILLQVPDASLDLASLIVPHAADRIYGQALGMRPISFFEGQDPTASVSFFLGFGWWLLVLLGLWMKGDRNQEPSATHPVSLPRRGPLALYCLAIFGLCLGPTIRWMGSPESLPSWLNALPAPYDWVSWVPFVQLSKSPVRWALVLQLGLAALAGRGVDGLWRGAGWRPWATIALVVLAFGEASELVPLRSLDGEYRVPRRFQEIAHEPGNFAVLDLPYDALPGPAHRTSSVAMALGAVHGRPIYFGVYPRATRRNLQQIRGRALFREIERLGKEAVHGLPAPAIDTVCPDAREDLRELHTRYVVLHEPVHSDERVKRQEQALRELLRRMEPAEETLLPLGPDYGLRLFRFEGSPESP